MKTDGDGDDGGGGGGGCTFNRYVTLKAMLVCWWTMSPVLFHRS